ncbi:acyltransferase [Aquisalinus flavus]|uniref:Acyltransferase n=1 Tax=Aquisalinus flavus TaxID=1526572 RepID=A0A8J2V3X7_9PROT|nr:acyltransferase [Aquisalinus flavus]MBD0425334.1 hypothetical protein [Aquisalinus flavus]UNE49014.1 hypothetical protein FF099_13630 [Aquisalinus flavus]GGD16924.1 hypothetical protein GCM10011342_27090 [Aquisalinus flavus]
MFNFARKQVVDVTSTRPAVPPIDAFTEITEYDPKNWSISGEGSGVFVRGKAVSLPQSVQIQGDNCRLYIDNGCFVNGHIEIKDGSNSVAYLGPRTRLRNFHAVLSGDSCLLVMGEAATTEQAVFFVHGDNMQITIGEDCMLSSGVVIRTADGHGIFDAESRRQINKPAAVHVGAHCWIGNGARVAKGVTISDGCVIGQMSLVSKPTEPNSIYAGVPARKVRSGTVWSRTDMYDDIPAHLLG